MCQEPWCSRSRADRRTDWGPPRVHLLRAQKHPAPASSPSSHLRLTFRPSALTLAPTLDYQLPVPSKMRHSNLPPVHPLLGQVPPASPPQLPVHGEKKEDFMFSPEVKTLDLTVGPFSRERGKTSIL